MKSQNMSKHLSCVQILASMLFRVFFSINIDEKVAVTNYDDPTCKISRNCPFLTCRFLTYVLKKYTVGQFLN